VDRRLPLALFLSFLVFFAWTILFAPKPEEQDQQQNAAPAESTAPATPGAAETTPPDGQAATPPKPAGPEPDVAASELVEDTLTVGKPGEPGYYEVGFSNLGARLTTLRFGSFFKRQGLSEEERRDHANWLPLLAPVKTDEGELGSILLRTSRSSADLAPEDLDHALWTYERLPDGTGARFTYGPGTGVLFSKEIRFEPGTWRLHVTLAIENESAGPERRCDFLLVPAGCLLPEQGDRFYPEPRAVAVGGEHAQEIAWKSALQIHDAGTLDVPLPLAFVGNHNKYFAFFLRGDQPDDTATLGGASYAPVLAPPSALIRNRGLPLNPGPG